MTDAATILAQIDVSKIDIVSAVWEKPPVNISKFARFNQLEWTIKRAKHDDRSPLRIPITVNM